MISNISPQISSYDTASTTSSSQQSSLTSSQQETLESVLSNYDAESLSADDASAIVSAFKDAGIEPSSELASAMEEAGFDAQEVGTLAGVGGPQGGGVGMPPPPSSAETEEVESLADILAELLDSEDDEDNTISSAYSSTSDSTSFESVLDYTSRILQLNDEAKSEVMELFDTYTSDESEITSNEANNIMKNSLKDILSDTNNYKNVSFYA